MQHLFNNRKRESKKWILIGLLLFALSYTDIFCQLRINEIIADNDSALSDPEFHEFADWIELYNNSNQSVSLNGMFLTDDPANLLKWSFPSGTAIPARGFLLVWADNKNSGLHTNFRLGNGGEFVGLTSTMSIVMDSISFGQQSPNVSFGRLPDGSDTWAYFVQPTPGQLNSSQSGNLISPPPNFSHKRGFYPSPISLTLTIPGGTGTIRYTRDGSEPVTSSDRYSAPLQLSGTTVLRARAYKDNAAPSPVVTYTFIINSNTTLPVFSISTDPKNLWDPDTGIYVEGRNYVWGWGNGNFWQDWEKEAFIEFFEQDRTVKISQAAGLKISGALSRTSSMKSLRLIARRTYGETKFDYRFFKDKPIKSFNEFKLRSSGNDWAFSMMKDGLLQTFFAGQMDIDRQAYRPTVVYLNGEYWGIHNLREMIGNDYLEENHGFDKNNIDLITQVGTAIDGDSKAYNDLIAYVKTHDMTSADNYAWVKERIDIQEYINYNVAEIYVANYDWPAGNIKYWRPRIPSGVWRWIVFDMDLAFDLPWHNTLEWATRTVTPDDLGSTDLFRILMTNPEFNAGFLQTFQNHLNTTFDSDRLIHIIDSIQSNIDSEMSQRHIDRWRNHHGWTFMDPVLGYIETPWLDSYSQWLTNVDHFRFFALERKSYIMGFLQKYFKLGDPVDLDFEVEPPGTGRILVDNALTVESTEDATYYTNQNLSVKALANPRYYLDKWEVRSNTLVPGQSVDLIPALSNWKYLDTGTYPGDAWKNVSFTETWPIGCALLGYGNENICTPISYGNDAQNKYITYLFRKKFNIMDAGQWSKLTVNLLRDDGAIVYLNGVEIVRSNMPQTSDFSTWASTGTDGIFELTYFPFEIPANLLRSGENVIAVEVHQMSPSSSDLTFDISLQGVVGSDRTNIEFFTTGELAKVFQWKTKVVAHFKFDGVIPDLSVNEVMTKNVSRYPDRLGSYGDWIEIYNPGSEGVDLGGMFVTDNVDNPGKWKIPGNNPLLTTVPANGFLVLFADEKTTLGPDHLGFKITGSGETIGISVHTSTGYTWIDTLSVPVLFPDVSYGRFPDGSNDWRTFTMNPTPQTANKEDSQISNEVVKLFPTYPNPFTDFTYIKFSIKEELPVQVSVRDMNGNLVDIITNRTYRAGAYRLEWDGHDSSGNLMTPGVYLITMITPYSTDACKTFFIH